MKRIQEEIAEANLSRQKTVRDVRLFITGRFSEEISLGPNTNTKRRFSMLARGLGQQIAKDAGTPDKIYETAQCLPDDATPLSKDAIEMLQALVSIKDKIL